MKYSLMCKWLIQHFKLFCTCTWLLEILSSQFIIRIFNLIELQCFSKLLTILERKNNMIFSNESAIIISLESIHYLRILNIEHYRWNVNFLHNNLNPYEKWWSWSYNYRAQSHWVIWMYTDNMINIKWNTIYVGNKIWLKLDEILFFRNSKVYYKILNILHKYSVNIQNFSIKFYIILYIQLWLYIKINSKLHVERMLLTL